MPASAFSNDNDKASFIIYNPAKETFVTFEDAAVRGDKEAVLPLPKDFAGDKTQAWMHYVSMEGDAVSTTVYLGEQLIA